MNGSFLVSIFSSLLFLCFFLIRESLLFLSQQASPVFFIKKKDGSLWLVQDYSTLNVVTIKNQCPIPLISELITQLHGTIYFTKLDVCWGFNNVQICNRYGWKATFHTNHGLFEPQVTFFSLTTSPTTFQTMMNDMF